MRVNYFAVSRVDSSHKAMAIKRSLTVRLFSNYILPSRFCWRLTNFFDSLVIDNGHALSVLHDRIV